MIIIITIITDVVITIIITYLSSDCSAEKQMKDERLRVCKGCENGEGTSVFLLIINSLLLSN